MGLVGGAQDCGASHRMEEALASRCRLFEDGEAEHRLFPLPSPSIEVHHQNHHRCGVRLDVGRAFVLADIAEEAGHGAGRITLVVVLQGPIHCPLQMLSCSHACLSSLA